MSVMDVARWYEVMVTWLMVKDANKFVDLFREDDNHDADSVIDVNNGP